MSGGRKMIHFPVRFPVTETATAPTERKST